MTRNIALLTLVIIAISSRGEALASQQPTWRSIGPTSIDGNYGLVAGRVSDIAVNDDGTIVLAGANGGLWRREAGGPWQPTGDALPSLAFGSIDHVGSIYYAASGENHGPCLDCAKGAGVFKSSNDGKSWKLLPDSPIQHSSSLRVSQLDASYVWVAGDKGLFLSTDGGSSWKAINRNGSAFSNPSSIALDSSKKERALVADDSGVFATSDAGNTWRKFDIPVGAGIKGLAATTAYNTALAVSKSDPNTILVSFSFANTNYHFGCLAGMYKSADGGSTWQAVQVPDYFSQSYAYGGGSQCQGWYDNILAMNPLKPKEIYAGGIALIRSEDAGATWSVVESTLHPDQHAIAFDRAGSAYVGNDGGVFQIDPAGHITDLTSGLSVTQFYQGLSLSSDGHRMIAGTQDNGTNINLDSIVTSTAEDAMPWRTVYGGDGGFTSIDQADAQNMYVEYVYGDMHRTTNGGANWAAVGPPVNHSAWIMPFAVDPSDWNTIYAGGDNVFKTTTGGPPWTQLTTWTGGANVSALAIAQNGKLIVAGKDDGTVSVSGDGGATWNPLTLGDAVTSVAIDPKTLDLYVAIKADDDAHVFEVSNMLTNPGYQEITGNLPPVNVLRMFDGTILAGSDNGVFELGEDNQWSLVGQGLPVAPVVDIAKAPDGSLIAATHGRGAWVLKR